jgi:hypothetical protein
MTVSAQNLTQVNFPLDALYRGTVSHQPGDVGVFAPDVVKLQDVWVTLPTLHTRMSSKVIVDELTCSLTVRGLLPVDVLFVLLFMPLVPLTHLLPSADLTDFLTDA